MIYGYLRNQRFDARNPLASTTDPLTQGQYGISFGGPIVQDRTFFFSNFEQTRLNSATVITIANPNVMAVNSKLDQISFRGPRISTGVVPTGFDTSNLLFRVEHQINRSNQFSTRFSL